MYEIFLIQTKPTSTTTEAAAFGHVRLIFLINNIITAFNLLVYVVQVTIITKYLFVISHSHLYLIS